MEAYNFYFLFLFFFFFYSRNYWELKFLFIYSFINYMMNIFFKKKNNKKLIKKNICPIRIL